MRHGLIAAFVIAAWLSPASAESVSDAIERIEARLQQLEHANARLSGLPGPRGAQGPPGIRGPQGPAGSTGPAGRTGPRGRDATLDGKDALTVGKTGRVRLGRINRGRPGIEIINTSNKQIGYFGRWNDSPHAGLHVADENGNRKVLLSSGGGGFVSLLGGGGFNVYSESNKHIAFMGKWNGHPSGGLYVTDGEGNRAVVLSGIKNGARIFVNGRNIHDYAEILELADREGIGAGSVVAWDARALGLVPASASNCRLVVGVISGAGGLRPGMVIGSREDGTSDFPVSMSGLVHVRVNGEGGAVRPGDLLSPSKVPGVGMRADDPLPGTVFGKALAPWSGDREGLVLMLVMNG
ncbi:MAG: hypothetical protein OXI22_05215 [Defluviicoccus sp.]|nr:hypothetical protein [Defluviicoccus sp.]MDE0383262.1 hypothetical protein [Defluviicoccus sp.]